MINPNPNCPKCGEPLVEITYPSDSMLNRDQWASQLAGDLFCACHNNNRGNKPYAYFWRRELDAPASSAPATPQDDDPSVPAESSAPERQGAGSAEQWFAANVVGTTRPKEWHKRVWADKEVEAYAASRLDSAIKIVRDKRDSCSEWTDEYKAWQAVIDVMEGK